MEPCRAARTAEVITYGVGVMRYRILTRRLVVGAVVGAVVTAVVTALSGAPAQAAAGPDVQARATSWDQAAAQLGTAGSLWDPVATAGLRRTGRITVLAEGLAFAKGRAISGDSFAGATYGRGATTFTISEKWANTGWAVEPAFTTSMAKVGVVSIPIGQPGMKTSVKARIYANCFVQPTDSDPTNVPAWFRCARSQVLTTGGVLVMTARPASTMTSPGNTSIVIQSTGLSYSQLLRIATSLQQVAGAPATGDGSGQMVAMCRQMTTGRMTFDQANAFAQSNGYSARVGSIDGVPQAVTADFRPDRFTLAIKSNVVSACTYG